MPSIYYGNPATNVLPMPSIYYGNPATNALPIPFIYYGNPAAKYQYLTYIAYKKLLTSLQHLTLCAPNTKLQRSVEKHDLNQKKRATRVTDFKNSRGAELVTCAGTTQYEWLESNGMLIVTAVDQEGWDSVKPGCDAGLAEAKELLQQAYTLCTDARAVEGPLTDQLRDGIASALDAVKLHVCAWEELLLR
ncbi:uncharacterized protein EDB91DRAFT_1086404 [Suillus paluster]|uniref:uncharacterized protein n=1 Tax=Suillus paluster TaxID=48578 RepID=UPI001B861BC3|nr:uncharacterized protein EDB91DRAFT_1086404 [Suillus paluster]KAG1727460.1 hypothetical protein EDB91DRAFT_1086404 [Suillus paluster]